MKYIQEIINRGALAFSEAAEDEFDAEMDSALEELDAPDEPEEEELPEDTEEDAKMDVNMEEDLEPIEEPKPEPEVIEKIQTIDTLSQIHNKFDLYMKNSEIQWDHFIINGRVKKAANFKYVEDLSVLLNKTLDPKTYRFTQVFNQLYDKLTDVNYGKSWNIYSRENYGKPFIGEGAALLLYELAVEWAVVLCRYFKDSPQFSPDVTPEEDSWFKKFNNLNFLTWIAKMITENSEFNKFLTSEKAKGILKEEGNYILTANQAKKKPHLLGMGESLSYYAGLVKENFGDITAGAMDKLGIVVFLSNNTKMPIGDRLNIIDRLINITTTRTTGPDANGNDPLMSALNTLDSTCTNLLKDRADARITLESNEKNYPMFVMNKV